MDLDQSSNLRKRGWSMHSEATAQSAQDELTNEQKEALLNNFPQHDDDDESRGASDTLDLAAGSDADSPPFKKQKKVSDELLQHAKNKLSKWAARLFDPDRPRGLVEAPTIIPLNDEFLAAFGKREKETDLKLGRKIVIDDGEIVVDDDDNSANGDVATTAELVHDFGSLKGRKLKVTNLAYTTTHERLLQACLLHGPVERVNIIMDRDDRTKSTGRAFVIFEQADDASACQKNMKQLDGRLLRWGFADAAPASASFANRGGGGGPSRYWERDISTKCFRCGQVGHIEPKCPNEIKPKPCPLCASLDHDTPWSCKLSRVCFNCGLPGHVNRECPERQPLPKRIACGICFASGHHRLQCRQSPYDAPNVAEAKCMICFKSGHFQCQDMKWFFGLDGVSCYNCGRRGHMGYACDRPPFEACARDEELARAEIDQAPALQLADDMQQQQRNRGRGRRDDRDGGGWGRAMSQPPPSRNTNASNRGYNNGNGNNRAYQVNDNRPSDPRGGGSNNNSVPPRGNNIRGYAMRR